jgi:hypothetical protein
MHHQDFTEASSTDEAFNRAVQVGAIVSLTAWDLLNDGAFFEVEKKRGGAGGQASFYVAASNICLLPMEITATRQ